MIILGLKWIQISIKEFSSLSFWLTYFFEFVFSYLGEVLLCVQPCCVAGPFIPSTINHWLIWLKPIKHTGSDTFLQIVDCAQVSTCHVPIDTHRLRAHELADIFHFASMDSYSIKQRRSWAYTRFIISAGQNSDNDFYTWYFGTSFCFPIDDCETSD